MDKEQLRLRQLLEQKAAHDAFVPTKGGAVTRSNYAEAGGLENWDLIRWRGAVASACRGKRGQEFFVALVESLEAMPVHELVLDELETEEGVCALGCLGRSRGVDMDVLDPNDAETVAKVFNIAPALAREVVYQNDEGACYPDTPTTRWERVHAWAKKMVHERS